MDVRLLASQLLLSPSDLNAFLTCGHRTVRDLQRARGEGGAPAPPRPDAQLVLDRGLRHEAEHLARLRAQGREVVEIAQGQEIGDAAAATLDAMRAGAEVVFQAAFLDPAGWQGHADFLVRVPASSAFGSWGYEAHDTKLAKHPKPLFVLQLAFYTEQIARLQGVMPEQMHVVLGSDEVRSFRYGDFAAYGRRVRAAFLGFLAEEDAPVPYPYPVEACAWCHWWKDCRDRRRADDHLSLVANLSRPQSLRLEAGGVRTVEELAALAPETRVPRVAARTLDGLRAQARLQVHTRETGEHVHELLPLEAGRGLARLPAPSAGDVFLDLEGDPYWGKEGLDYLFGSLTPDGGHDVRWAHDEAGERAAFEGWMDWITARLAEHPDLHVYHYNHYEPTALKRLMGKYGTREAELDLLLRREVLVDLYTVVRQGLRVGEESYSLKAMEVFLPMERDAEITEAGGSILAYQEYLDGRDPAKLEAIRLYNADDCGATLALRDWLLELRAQAGAPPREAPKERTPAPREDLERLRAQLVARGDLLLAELLDYHRREAKPAWWAYFDRLTKSPGELREEDSEALGDLTPADLPWREAPQSVVIPLSFPPQQHKLGPGDVLDPERELGLKLVEVDEVGGIAWIKRARRLLHRPLPRALVPGRPLPQGEQHAALVRLAESDRPVARALLERRAPARLDGLPAPGDVRLVQGPPGAGKTWTGARLVVDLIAAGRRVGVTATAHKAIHNLLDEVVDVAAERGISFRGLKKGNAGNPESHYDRGPMETVCDNGALEPVPDDVALVAGTPFLFARAGLADAVDVLVVDEAGQVALADALAVSASAASLVLLGDPQQLAHVSQGRHPEGAGRSVLEHLLDGAPTVAPGRGIFLERSYRMHPAVCSFVSEESYEGRLESAPGCEERTVGGEAGLRLLTVEHEGNRQSAPEEAEAIAARVQRLLADGLALEDVLVVAAYNAQVRCLRSRLPAGARVGTVDKFQGQEAPVVFFSLASSSGEDVPRGMEFLLSRNRLNVAISRAQSLAVVVCAPRLLVAECRTVEQMRLVNALCRFAELAAPW